MFIIIIISHNNNNKHLIINNNHHLSLFLKQLNTFFIFLCKDTMYAISEKIMSSSMV